jgi:site-specific DNA recombinase
MALTGSDRSGPRVRCSRYRESGSCSNGTKYYIDKIERLVLDRLKTQIDNPKLVGQFVEAYLAERRALSATARRDKVKIAAQIAMCQRGIDNLVTAVEKGTLEPEEIASRLQVQRSEKARLQRELESADALVMSVDLHPTAIKRFKQNLEQISAAGGQIDAQVATSFRELIDSVVVMARKPGEPYRLETRGPSGSLDWWPRWGCWNRGGGVVGRGRFGPDGEEHHVG